MGLNASKVAGRQASAIEADAYLGYLVQVIDLGLQEQRPYQGVSKPPSQEIMLTYELSDCFLLDDEGNEQLDKPRWISETMPFRSLRADKAKSTERYHAFDPDERFGGDFTKVLGAPTTVIVVNNQKNGNTYANVGSLAPVSTRKAQGMNPLKGTPRVFDLTDPDLEVFDALPDWLKEKIKGNLEFKGSKLESLLAGTPAPQPKAEAPKAEPVIEEDEDDNPY